MVYCQYYLRFIKQLYIETFDGEMRSERYWVTVSVFVFRWRVVSYINALTKSR